MEINQDNYPFDNEKDYETRLNVLAHPYIYKTGIEDLTIIRNLTGSGWMYVKNAIMNADGDFFKILDIIAKQGIPAVQIVDSEKAKHMEAPMYRTNPVYILAFLGDIYVEDAKKVLTAYNNDLRLVVKKLFASTPFGKSLTDVDLKTTEQ